MTAAELAVGLLLVVLAVLASTPWLLPRKRGSDAGGSGAGRGGVIGGDALDGRASGGGPGGCNARRRSGRAAQHVAVDDAVVLDLVRAALVAGADIVSALEAVGTALPRDQGESYRRAGRALRLGASWQEAWLHAEAVATALAPAWTDGVDPDPLLAHAAETIRRTRQVRAREAAARLGVRLVLPVGLCLLPAFVLLGLVPLLVAAGLDLWDS